VGAGRLTFGLGFATRSYLRASIDISMTGDPGRCMAGLSVGIMGSAVISSAKSPSRARLDGGGERCKASFNTSAAEAVFSLITNLGFCLF